MKVKNGIEIYNLIDTNIKSRYTFTERSKVVIWDCIKKEKREKELKGEDDLIETLNSCEESVGNVLYEYLKEESEEEN